MYKNKARVFNVENLPRKVQDIRQPFGGISQTAVLTLFGIQSIKYCEFRF